MSLKFNNVEPEKRRTWNKEYYEKRAKDREKEEIKEILNLDLDQIDSKKDKNKKQKKHTIRDLLRPRNYKIDLEGKIGRKEILINNNKTNDNNDNDLDNEIVTKKELLGWYCKVCECQLKDSHTYLDHINGKKHQKKLGMSMKTPNSTLDEVKQRLNYHKRKYKEFNINDIKNRILENEKNELKIKKFKKMKKKEKKINDKLNSFKNQELNKYEIDKIYSKNKKRKLNIKEYKTDNNVGKDESIEDDIDLVVEKNPLMDAMGFNFSFGGSKKNR